MGSTKHFLNPRNCDASK